MHFRIVKYFGATLTFESDAVLRCERDAQKWLLPCQLFRRLGSRADKLVAQSSLAERIVEPVGHDGVQQGLHLRDALDVRLNHVRAPHLRSRLQGSRAVYTWQ